MCVTSIHPSNVPWVHHPLVSNAYLTIIFHASLSCTFLFRTYISSLYHSFTSSSSSLFSLPLFVFPSISPNTTSFTSLLSSILQMCPNKFNFLSLILCMMFLLLPILFLISSFVILQRHFTNSQMRYDMISLGDVLIIQCNTSAYFLYHHPSKGQNWTHDHMTKRLLSMVLTRGIHPLKMHMAYSPYFCKIYE